VIYRNFPGKDWQISSIGYGMWGLAGWTGKEPVFAKAIIDTWNQIESR
jgi:aryl-alcohol dehydrogenase-like predicted oxidoreductase